MLKTHPRFYVSKIKFMFTSKPSLPTNGNSVIPVVQMKNLTTLDPTHQLTSLIHLPSTFLCWALLLPPHLALNQQLLSLSPLFHTCLIDSTHLTSAQMILQNLSSYFSIQRLCNGFSFLTEWNLKFLTWPKPLIASSTCPSLLSNPRAHRHALGSWLQLSAIHDHSGPFSVLQISDCVLAHWSSLPLASSLRK